jgi:hypothetical protein
MICKNLLATKTFSSRAGAEKAGPSKRVFEVAIARGESHLADLLPGYSYDGSSS